MSRRKRTDFAPSNTADNGDYMVGKGRPPESGKFKKGDGRKRGRRPLGTNNLATDFRKELNARVAVTVGGEPKTVSRQRAIIMRLADNAMKGQNSAIALTLELLQRLGDPKPEKNKGQNPQDGLLDLTKLSLEELLVFEYLTSKASDRLDDGIPIVGVLPIYRNGVHLDSRAYADIKVGLLAYGIEIDEMPPSPRFQPKCLVIKKADNT